MQIIKLNNKNSILIESSNYYFIENNILDKKIKNHETGREIKVSTALGYKDENPSLYNKVKSWLKSKLTKKEENPKEIEKELPTNGLVNQGKIFNNSSSERKAREKEAKKILTPKKLEDFYKSNDYEKIEHLYSTNANGFKREYFDEILKHFTSNEVENLIDITNSDIEDSEDARDDKMLKKSKSTNKMLKDILINKKSSEEDFDEDKW